MSKEEEYALLGVLDTVLAEQTEKFLEAVGNLVTLVKTRRNLGELTSEQERALHRLLTENGLRWIVPPRAH